MRTRFKTLTVGLVLATAAMAGCSSTTAGSSGAVQNDATAPTSSAAASSAASTGPAPSPDPVTPTATPTEAPASAVASPTDSPSGSESPQSTCLECDVAPNNDVCAEGLQYSCGGIGASGVGTVFYASTTPFACGADMASTCNYLEVAPKKWNGKLENCPGNGTGWADSKSTCGGSPNATSDWGSSGPGAGKGYPYCKGKGQKNVIPNASGTLIGTGYPNTSAMLTMCKSGDAAGQVRRYTGGGMTDWSLPSQDELNALYYYTGRNAIGGFAADEYWSSSQLNKNVAWDQKFTDGSQAHVNKLETHGVRPVRAF